MFRIAIPLAFVASGVLSAISCAHSLQEDKSLAIKTENRLTQNLGILESNADGIIMMRALSYPSALKYYTDKEVFRILRFTCDSRAVLPRIYGREERSLSIEWNFTGSAKGAGGTIVQGVARFGATLTELSPGRLHIICGERVY